MLKLFKSHLAFIPTSIMLVFMLFLRLELLFSNYSINNWESCQAPFSTFFVNIVGLELLLNPYFNIILSSIIIMLNAIVFISILNLYKNKVLKTFIPAWIFILLMHLDPCFSYLSPQLFSLSFILLGIKKIVVFSKDGEEKKWIFEIGFYIGIAAMFWSPSILFLLLSFYFLSINNQLSFKKIILLLFSVSIPVFYVLTYYFLIDEWHYNIFNELHINDFNINIQNISNHISLLFAVILSFSSLLYVSTFLKKQLKQIKMLFSLSTFYILNYILIFILHENNSLLDLLFLFFPISMFLTIYFDRIKRNVLAEFIHLVLIISIIVNYMHIS